MKMQDSCRKILRRSDIELSCLDDLENSIDNCFYVDYGLVSSDLLKKMKSNNVFACRLHPMKLRPKISKNMTDLMDLELKKQILKHEVFQFENVDDAKEAKGFNMDAKIEDEAFYRRNMLERIIIYDEEFVDETINEMLKRKDIVCIGCSKVTLRILDNIRDHSLKTKMLLIFPIRLSTIQF